MTSSFGMSESLGAALTNIHVSNPLLKTAMGASESLTGTTIAPRVKNKFENGWLGGVGSTSQFQGVNSTLPVLPFDSTNDLESRIRSVHGSYGRAPLAASWQRSYAFAPGRGKDALATKITFTDENAGRDTLSAVVGPHVNAGVDRFTSGPIAPTRTYGTGGQGVQDAPVVTTGGEAGSQAIFDINTAGHKKNARK